MPDRSVDPWEPLRGELAADVRRVADRLRSMSTTRLAAPLPRDDGLDHGSRADAAREVAGVLATAAARLDAAPSAPVLPPPALPVLGLFAAGDQVAVTGHDLLAALDAVVPDEPLRGVVADAAARLADLRRRL